ncbi:MAG: VanZ family protein [Oscillospiraceae bacterium]|nr:VanZ family protein [Oscillospiraceae bacterium]
MNAGKKKLNTLLFGVYCTMMLWLLFHRAGPADGLHYWEQIKMSINLIPLHTVMRYVRLLDSSRPVLVRLAVINLFGNVIMFIPLGFFLPLIFARLRRLWKTLITTLLSISIIEILQLFTLLGSCDIDDLILNLAGAAIGYGLYRMMPES